MKKLLPFVLVLLVSQVFGEPKQIAEIRKKAEAGEVASQSLLGSHYFLDLADGEKTQKEAVKWLRAAGEQGDAQSQYFLGRIFSTGCPEKYFLKDDEEAVKWWRKAAATGYTDALKALGKSYFEGRGVSQDHKEAAKWYRQAAEQGDHQAQRHLGDQYRFGQGVAKDLVKAHAWYELSIHFVPEWQRQRQGGRAPVDLEREVLAQKMTLEQTKEAGELSKELLKKIEANKK